jgi:serine phosphatase RsbU (regulator of sigma subunit)/CHASE2 domain-containing sensor protein
MTPSPAAEHRASRIGRIRIAGLAFVVAWTVLIGAQPRVLARLSAAGFDAWQALMPRAVVSMPATVVAIDEKSVAALGRWPWPRTRLAALVESIGRQRPAALGLDLYMPEPDRLSPDRVLAELGEVPAAAASAIAAMPTNDAVLARALAGTPSVLAVAGTVSATGRALRVAPIAVVGADPVAAAAATSRLERFGGTVNSLPELERAASGWGLVSVRPEQGVIRRFPLAASVDGTLVPAFAVELLRVAMRVPALRLVVSGSSIEAIALGDLAIASEGDGAARLHFSRSVPARFVSAVDVLEGRVDPDRLAARIVIVGATALGLGESHTTPLGDAVPGSELHAQLVESIYDGTLLLRPAWAPSAEAIAFALAGAWLAWAVPSWRLRRSVPLAAGSVAIFAAASLVAFRWQRHVLDAALPALGIVVLFGLLLMLTLAEATRRRRALEQVLQIQRERSARIAGELEAARRIQTASLPSVDLVAGDARIDLAASMVPAREVGGDLYDFYRLDERRLFVLVGDVAGKGLPASIFMAVSKALYKSAALRDPGGDPGTLMTEANAEVSRDNAGMLFVTAFAATLDLDTGELVYCNAGHENPFVVDPEDGVARLEGGGGPPLCAVDGFAYRSERRQLRRGAMLCVVSDGITEATDPAGALFGSDRVRGILADLRRMPPAAADVVAMLRDRTHAFMRDAEPADDATVLALVWRGPPR